MNGLLALVSTERRASRADFWLALPVMLAVMIASAVAMLAGVAAAVIPFIVTQWCWLALHVNRRHDIGRSGRPLVFLLPWLFVGALLLAAAIIVVTGYGMPAPTARPTGQEPVFVYVYVLTIIIAALADVPIETRPAALVLFALALVLLAPCIIASLVLGTARGEPAPNRWGASLS
jgi:uncharacterized membrane protein YhaH (DUF805 family)